MKRRQHHTAAPLCLILLLGLAACHADIGEKLQSGRVLGLGGTEGRWVGPVTPTNPNCGQPTTGLMSVGGGRFSLDPFQSTVVINGPSKDGHLEGEMTRSAPGQAGVTTRFVGDLRQPADGPSTIQGTLSSSRCHWTVMLHRG